MLPRPVHRVILVSGATMLGLVSLAGLAVFVALASGDTRFQVVIDDESIAPGSRPPALLIASLGEAVVGATLLVSAVALLVGRDLVGLRLGRAGMIFGLAADNVLLGYVSAEVVVVVVVAELALLASYRRYRTCFGPPVAGAARCLRRLRTTPPSAGPARRGSRARRASSSWGCSHPPRTRAAAGASRAQGHQNGRMAGPVMARGCLSAATQDTRDIPDVLPDRPPRR